MKSHPRLCHFTFSPCWHENKLWQHWGSIRKTGNLSLWRNVIFPNSAAQNTEAEGLLIATVICWHMILNLLVKAEGQPSALWSPHNRWCFTYKSSTLKQLYLLVGNSVDFEIQVVLKNDNCNLFSYCLFPFRYKPCYFLVAASFHLTKCEHLNIETIKLKAMHSLDLVDLLIPKLLWGKKEVKTSLCKKSTCQPARIILDRNSQNKLK